MQSRFLIFGMAAVPGADGTRSPALPHYASQEPGSAAG